MNKPTEQEMRDVQKHVQHHVIVAMVLIVGSATTLWTSQTHFFSSFAYNIGATLAVASIQGFLVAAYYMHLLSQKKMIYTFLVFTAIFFIVMIGITFWARMPENVIHIRS